MKDITGFTGVIPAPIKQYEVGEPRRVVVEKDYGNVLRVSMLDGSGTFDVDREVFTPIYFRKNDDSPNAELCGARRASEPTPGYAGDNNGE